MPSTRASIVTVIAIWAAGQLACSPKDTTGPDHPANPGAAQAPPAPAPTEPPAAGEPDDGGHGGHDHAGDPSAAEPGHDHGAGQAEPEVPPLIAAEMAAYEAAKPVFAKYCAECHTTGAGKPSKKRKQALKHFAIDQYPFTGHHAGELGETVRKVLGVGKGKATMPMDDPGAVKGAELDAIVAWSRAYDAAAKAGAGYHGEAKSNDHGSHGH